MSLATYIDNAPDQDGTQLLLSRPLTVEEQEHVSNYGDYSQDEINGQVENVFINCDDDEKPALIVYLDTISIVAKDQYDEWFKSATEYDQPITIEEFRAWSKLDEEGNEK